MMDTRIFELNWIDSLFKLLDMFNLTKLVFLEWTVFKINKLF